MLLVEDTNERALPRLGAFPVILYSQLPFSKLPDHVDYPQRPSAIERLRSFGVLQVVFSQLRLTCLVFVLQDLFVAAWLVGNVADGLLHSGGGICFRAAK